MSSPPLLIAAADLDRDRAPDLIALGDGNSVRVALNAGGPAPRLAQFGLLDSPGLTQIAKAVLGGGPPTVTGEVALEVLRPSAAPSSISPATARPSSSPREAG